MAYQKNILIIKFGALGDVFLSEGQVRAILKRHRDDKITILTEPAMVGIFRLMTHRTRKKPIHFLTIVRKHYWRLPWLVMTLGLKKFDRVYDLQTSRYSARLYYLLWKKPLWNGVVKNIWKDHSKDRHRTHAIGRFNKQLASAGIFNVPLPRIDYLHGKRPSFYQKKYMMLIIGGSAVKWRKKQIWPIEHFIALACWLEQKNILSVVVGGDLEKSNAEKFITAVPSAINLVGQGTLGDVAEVARHAIGVVGNDTGLTHLAALAWRDAMEHKKLSPLIKKWQKKKKQKKITRHHHKKTNIVVLVSPPAIPKTMRPLDNDQRVVKILYHKNIAQIKPAMVIDVFARQLNRR